MFDVGCVWPLVLCRCVLLCVCDVVCVCVLLLFGLFRCVPPCLVVDVRVSLVAFRCVLLCCVMLCVVVGVVSLCPRVCVCESLCVCFCVVGGVVPLSDCCRWWCPGAFPVVWLIVFGGVYCCWC